MLNNLDIFDGLMPADAPDHMTVGGVMFAGRKDGVPYLNADDAERVQDACRKCREEIDAATEAAKNN
jgi:hypothetical protein